MNEITYQLKVNKQIQNCITCKYKSLSKRDVTVYCYMQQKVLDSGIINQRHRDCPLQLKECKCGNNS